MVKKKNEKEKIKKEFANFAEKISKLESLKHELELMNTRGFEQEAKLIKAKIKDAYFSVIVAYLNTVFVRVFGKEYGLLGVYSNKLPKMKFLLSTLLCLLPLIIILEAN